MSAAPPHVVASEPAARARAARGPGRPRALAGARLDLQAATLVTAAVGCADARAGELRGKVTRIRDGDTIELRSAGETIRVRVFAVDCPERGQPWAAKAKQTTASLAGSRDVVVRVKSRDVYGR